MSGTLDVSEQHRAEQQPADAETGEAIAAKRRPNFSPNFSMAPEQASEAQAAVSAWTPDGEEPAPLDENAIIGAIATVFDPEIPVNIYELGLIYAIDLHDDGRVKVEMTLTAPGCPSAQELPVQVRDAILLVPSVTGCEVETVWDPPWDMSRMSEDARLSLNMF